MGRFRQWAVPVPASQPQCLAWLMLALNLAVWRFDPSFARFRSDAVHLAPLEQSA